MKRTLQERIRERLADLRIDPTEGSRRSGLSKDYLRKLLESPEALPQARNMEKLAAGLETTVAWLLTEDGAKEAPVSAGTRTTGFRPVEAVNLGELRSSMALDVAVLGTAAGSLVREGGFEIQSRVLEYARRPPALLGVPDAYAILVSGDSMAPEYRDGSLQFVHPHRRPVVDEGVIVQAQYDKSGVVEAYLGNFVRRTATKLIVAKHNPQCFLEFNLDYVRHVHKVLTHNELYGM